METVTTGKQNEESRLLQFKKPPADLADFGRLFGQNPENLKKQPGKHRIKDAQAPLWNAIGIGVFPKKHRFLNRNGVNDFFECRF